MTVYILFWINFHSEREFIGVFSSRENAQAHADKFKGEKHEIDEQELDEV